MERLGIDPAFGDRYLNEGFSGGEKKRNEILQMAILEPEFAVLDETDSGLDIDALKVVAKGVQEVRTDRPELGVLLITHYQRILAAPGARRGAHPRRRPHRRRAAAPSWPTASSRRATTHGAALSAGSTSTSTRSRRTSRSSSRDIDGAPPRLPRLGGQLAEAPGRARRHGPLLRDDPRQRAPGRLHHRRGGHRSPTRRPAAKVARFIGAPSPRGVVFTKNATEAINLVAHAWGRANLATRRRRAAHRDGAPRQPRPLADAAGGAGHRAALPRRSTDDGRLVLDDLDRLLDGVKLVGVTAMSNVLGTLNPVRRIADAAHAAGAVVLVDARPVRAPPAHRRRRRWAATSWPSPATRCCGPTGIGVLWGREELLEAMPAFLGGGEMIRDVRLDGWTPNELPWKFEAGTPPIAEAVGLGAAVDYLEALGMDAVREHEVALTGLRPAHAHRAPRRRPAHLRPARRPTSRGGVLSFTYARHPPPRPLPGARPARACASGPATTAPSR